MKGVHRTQPGCTDHPLCSDHKQVVISSYTGKQALCLKYDVVCFELLCLGYYVHLQKGNFYSSNMSAIAGMMNMLYN